MSFSNYMLILSLILLCKETKSQSGSLGSGSAWRCEYVREGFFTVRACRVWINLKDTSHIIEASPYEYSGHADTFVTQKSRTLAAINANWFTEDASQCNAAGTKVIGIASSAGVRFPPGVEQNILNRASLACTWSNVCDIISKRDLVDDLDKNTRAGTSVYKNIISGTPHFITEASVSIPQWCSDCRERDAISAIGLAGSKTHGGRYEYMYFVVTEGRRLSGDGTLTLGWTLSNLAEFMKKRFGVKEALRLDSGGSAQLAIEDIIDGTRQGRRISLARSWPNCEPRPVRNLLTLRRR